MPYDQKQYADLSLRAKTVLGLDSMRSLAQSTPRRQAYSIALSKAVKAMGSPSKVTDEQILGAFEIAHEVFPTELETLSKAYYRQTSEPSTL